MKSTLTLFAFCSCVSLACAELTPALKSHADKFETDRAALTASAETYLKPVRDRYLAVLASAEKATIAAGGHAESPGIASEMLDISAGSPANDFPPDLP